MSDHSGDAPDLGGDGPARMLAEVRTLLDEVREALLDTASGEVVGALWDEFRSVRESLDELAGAAAAIEQLGRLQGDVSDLTSAVRDLVARSETSGPGEGGTDDDGHDEMLRSMASDVAALRSELSEGLVVEPSDALAGTVDQLRADLAGLHDRMQAVTELRAAVDELRASSESTGADRAAGLQARFDEQLASLSTGVESVLGRLDELADPQGDDALTAIAADVAAVRAELGSLAPRAGDDDLRSVRTGIEDIIARLDEGLELADDIAPPAAGAGPELADQVATLRDHITAEFDALRQLIDTIAAEPADESEQAPAGADYAAVDPDTIDLLREEIRAAGGASDDLVEAMRKELVALRRRIKLRAEGELFSSEQLDRIAEAVARRLAE